MSNTDTSNNQFTIGFVGGGNMANALIKGLKNNGFDPQNIMVVDLDETKRTLLAQSLNVQVSDNLQDISKQDAIVLAVKPQQLKQVAQALAPHLKAQLIISIAAGIRLNDLSQWLGNHTKIIRTMPNTPSQIQAGVTGMYPMPDVSKHQRSIAEKILTAAGITVWLDDESKLDAVTAISGSGPAYVFFMIEALSEAAITLGLTPEQANLLAIQTFKGASLLAEQSDTPVQTLREQVTSKGGTTEQGLLSLEKSQVKTAIIQAAKAAEARAKTLADELGNS